MQKAKICLFISKGTNPVLNKSDCLQARKLSCGNYFASSPGKQKILLGLITSHHGSYLSAPLRPLPYEGGLGKGGFLLSFAMETEKENMTITCSLDSLDLFF